jgi:glucosamine--fructose-6-phosphate aminotransferase (isomerizing)
MCGIVGYSGDADTVPVLLDGLEALEYRGYDSAGLYTQKTGRVRSGGRVSDLRDKVGEQNGSSVGIAHTRWATHGPPSEKNAHPHTGNDQIYLVHNGIVENHESLKEKLSQEGREFESDTDTEVLAHLIEFYYGESQDLLSAVEEALRHVEGTYGIAVMDTSDSGEIIAARMSSPIVIGVGNEENFIASDPVPIRRHTQGVVYLKDGEIARVSADDYEIHNRNKQTQVNRKPQQIEWDVEEAKKEGHEHFMEKEIFEGPDVVKDSIRGRVLAGKGNVKLGGLEEVADQLRDIERLIIVACGTARLAGSVGEYMLEEYAGIPVEVEIASEFRYRKPLIDENTAVLAVSQSGETADTLAAIQEAKQKGALTLGIVNVVGSTIAREVDAGVYNHAGPEISVASTKAFISQLSVLALLTVFLGRQRGMSREYGKRIGEELKTLPDKIETILNTQTDTIKSLAEKYHTVEHFMYIARKYNYPLAFEGALKLKEVSYIHAEGYGAGEMKHGPLALVDENFPTFAIAPKDSVHEKMLSNIEEIKARGGPVVAVGTDGDDRLQDLVDDVISIPKALEMLTPVLATVPLQLFAYHVAKVRGTNIDKPRNLAKSVTVE